MRPETPKIGAVQRHHGASGRRAACWEDGGEPRGWEVGEGVAVSRELLRVDGYGELDNRGASAPVVRGVANIDVVEHVHPCDGECAARGAIRRGGGDAKDAKSPRGVEGVRPVRQHDSVSELAPSVRQV